MRLHIFEPRYRLLVRRAMEGSRRLGMAAPAAGGSVAPIASECTPAPPVVSQGCHVTSCGHSSEAVLWVPAALSQSRCTFQ